MQFTDKVIDKPVVAQRQISVVQTIQKTMEIPQSQCADEAIGGTVVQVPRAQVVEKTVGIPQFQIVEKTVEAPQLQIGAQTSESLGSAPVRQVAQVSTTGVVKPDDPDAGDASILGSHGSGHKSGMPATMGWSSSSIGATFASLRRLASFWMRRDRMAARARSLSSSKSAQRRARHDAGRARRCQVSVCRILAEPQSTAALLAILAQAIATVSDCVG